MIKYRLIHPSIFFERYGLQEVQHMGQYEEWIAERWVAEDKEIEIHPYVPDSTSWQAAALHADSTQWRRASRKEFKLAFDTSPPFGNWLQRLLKI